MAQLTISLLGPFFAAHDDCAVIRFETVRARALLAYLADEPGRMYPRTMLAELLWPERAHGVALNNLRSVLVGLRLAIQDGKSQPPYLLINRETIALNPEGPLSVDTVRFLHLLSGAGANGLVTDADFARLEQAVSLYRGDFLESFPPLESAEFEGWILMRREKYRTQALEAMFSLAEVNLDRRDYQRASALAQRQIAVESWREEAYIQWMTALALEGRRSEALAVFSNCRDELKNELGVKPGQATLHLFESILEGTFYSAASSNKDGRTGSTQVQITTPNSFGRPRNDLPHPLTSLIGREEDIAQVVQLLDKNRMVMLSGAGGVGKSRLALAVADQAANSFRDGVWFVELAPLVSADQLPGAVAQALGLGKGPWQPDTVGLANFFSRRQALLILDNCEHIVESCAGLSDALLKASPELKILATSRERLDLEGEIVYRVPSLGFPFIEKLPSWQTSQEYSSVRMFVDRARAILPDFSVTEKNWLSIASICRRLDGIPLAIELCATHLDLLDPEQLAARLDGSFHLLTSACRTALPRHQTLQATIDWSFGRLSPAERLMLARISVFSGDLTLEAAEEVCMGNDIQGDDILNLLTSLVAKSMLIARRNAAGQVRFYLLETVRQYANEKLRDSQEEEVLHARHCAYFRKAAEAAMLHLRTGDHLVWMEKLDADRQNIFSAVRWAIDGAKNPSAGCRILSALDRWWTLRGYLFQGLSWYRKGLEHWGEPSHDELPHFIKALSVRAHLETDPKVAFKTIEKALAIVEIADPQHCFTIGSVFFVAGYLYRTWQRDGLKACEFLDRALQFQLAYHPPGWQWSQAIILDEKSSALRLLGDLDRSDALARESWAMFRKLGDHWFSGPLRNLAINAMRRGEYARARQYFIESIEQAAGVEDGLSFWPSICLARIEGSQGHYIQALTKLREALRFSSEQFFYFQTIDLLREIAYTEIASSRGKGKHAEESPLRHAACLLGAAEACQAVDRLIIFIYPMPIVAEMCAELHARLDSSILQPAWDEGSSISVEQAVKYALEYS